MLAAAIDDVASLRHHDLSFKSWSPHVWNVIDGAIVDITATQFKDLDEFQPYLRGVLVTRKPHVFHGQVAGSGGVTLAYLECIGNDWYDGAHEQRQFQRALSRARASLPR
jgi:hypothetical protein